jgi:hypothetical protein
VTRQRRWRAGSPLRFSGRPAAERRYIRRSVGPARVPSPTDQQRDFVVSPGAWPALRSCEKRVSGQPEARCTV